MNNVIGGLDGPGIYLVREVLRSGCGQLGLVNFLNPPESTATDNDHWLYGEKNLIQRNLLKNDNLSILARVVCGAFLRHNKAWLTFGS